MRLGLRDDLHVRLEALQALAHHDVALAYPGVEAPGDAAKQQDVRPARIDEQLRGGSRVDGAHAAGRGHNVEARDAASRKLHATATTRLFSPKLEERERLLVKRAEHCDGLNHGTPP